ncbi:hypothetical protein F5Y19DRAFT_478205 [Xylariaceae sp. FL1651]|nr:hypothetical protein F5Y19DRAFT_478205 [Xylariaceae sp. FL1651]
MDGMKTPGVSLTFFNIPGEIRNKIYKEVLIEPGPVIQCQKVHGRYAWKNERLRLLAFRDNLGSLADRPRHINSSRKGSSRKGSSRKGSSRTSSSRKSGSPKSSSPKKSANSDSCSCFKIISLGLLLVSRQVYNEASSIYWSCNNHVFCSVKAFVGEVSRLPAWRYQQIQYVYIGEMHITSDDNPDAWKLLQQCTSLRVLRVPYSFAAGWKTGWKTNSLVAAGDAVAIGAAGVVASHPSLSRWDRVLVDDTVSKPAEDDHNQRNFVWRSEGSRKFIEFRSADSISPKSAIQ